MRFANWFPNTTDWQPTGRTVRGVPEYASPSLGTTVLAEPHMIVPAESAHARQAHARSTDPPTAHEAARTAQRALRSDEDAVLRAHIDAGARGLTGDELEQVLGRGYAQVGPRRPALVRRGLLVPVPGARRPNRRGNQEQVYRATGLAERGTA